MKLQNTQPLFGSQDVMFYQTAYYPTRFRVWHAPWECDRVLVMCKEQRGGGGGGGGVTCIEQEPGITCMEQGLALAAFHVGPGWAPVGPSWAPVGPRLGLTGAHLGMLLGSITCREQAFHAWNGGLRCVHSIGVGVTCMEQGPALNVHGAGASVMCIEQGISLCAWSRGSLYVHGAGVGCYTGVAEDAAMGMHGAGDHVMWMRCYVLA